MFCPEKNLVFAHGSGHWKGQSFQAIVKCWKQGYLKRDGKVGCQARCWGPEICSGYCCISGCPHWVGGHQGGARKTSQGKRQVAWVQEGWEEPEAGESAVHVWSPGGEAAQHIGRPRSQTGWNVITWGRRLGQGPDHVGFGKGEGVRLRISLQNWHLKKYLSGRKMETRSNEARGGRLCRWEVTVLARGKGSGDGESNRLGKCFWRRDETAGLI